MYNYFCRQKAIDKITRVKRYSLLLAATIVALAFPAKFIIENWLTKYIDSISVLFFLIAAQYVAVMIKIVHVNLYKSRKQQKKYFRIMLCVIVTSAILNIVGYLLFKNMVAIAVATLATNIIWFIIGEIDLREYALNIKDYIYFILNIIMFVFCGLQFDAIVGILVYGSIIVCSSLILEFSTCKKLSMEVKKYLLRITKKRKKAIK